MAGYFITFEGIDKSGKSTQIALLADRLQADGHSTVVTHEPGGTPLGREIRNLVLTNRSETVPSVTELLLFAADRAHHTEQLIRPSLEAGQVVISDRYLDSTLAYQGYGLGIDLDRIRKIMLEATGGLTPDLTVLVDIDLQTSRDRLGVDSPDRMEERDDAFFGRVRDGYLRLADAEPDRFLSVDGAQPVESLARTIYSEVESRLRDAGTRKSVEASNLS